MIWKNKTHGKTFFNDTSKKDHTTTELVALAEMIGKSKSDCFQRAITIN